MYENLKWSLETGHNCKVNSSNTLNIKNPNEIDWNMKTFYDKEDEIVSLYISLNKILYPFSQIIFPFFFSDDTGHLT